VAAKRRSQTNGFGLDVEVRDSSAEGAAATPHLSPGARAMQRLIDPALFADPYAAANFIGMDLEGNIQVWNEGARRLYGCEPEAVIGRANLTILPRSMFEAKV
jgi:PAS domain-containing protein